MASEIGGLEPLHGYLKHGNLVVRMRIPYLKLDEPAEKFIERKMTTPATATPATMPAKEPEPAQVHRRSKRQHGSRALPSKRSRSTNRSPQR